MLVFSGRNRDRGLDAETAHVGSCVQRKKIAPISNQGLRAPTGEEKMLKAKNRLAD